MILTASSAQEMMAESVKRSENARLNIYEAFDILQENLFNDGEQKRDLFDDTDYLLYLAEYLSRQAAMIRQCYRDIALAMPFYDPKQATREELERMMKGG